MRYKDSQEQLVYLKEASNLGNLELFYAALDVLGSTPWKINREIFDVVLKVWNSGERLGKIPPAVLEDKEPEKPESWGESGGERDARRRVPARIRESVMVRERVIMAPKPRPG